MISDLPDQAPPQDIDLLPFHPASFRDPSGFIFEYNGGIYRSVHESFKPDFDFFVESGLCRGLIDRGWLVSHSEATDLPRPDGCAYILRVQRLPFINYPYEWSFGQLREAALLTLDILSVSLDHGMVLKDATGFNVVWHCGRPVFIDTLSFARYVPGKPWQGYRQFCTHFLAPLALMHHVDVRFQSLLRSSLEGIPLELASRMLPWRTRFGLGLGVHIHMHSRSERRHSDVAKRVAVNLPLTSLRNLVENLRDTVSGLLPPSAPTVWGNYYADTNYSEAQFEEKKGIVASWLERSSPAVVLDLGANDGTFSRLAASAGSRVVSADMDHTAVQLNYVRCRAEEITAITPILLDITNPSPGIGWLCRERDSFFSRLKPDLGMALALVHHLAIGHNIPLPMILEGLAITAPRWIVEFVDKHDSQVQRLLANRDDVFPLYSQEHFESAAGSIFAIEAKQPISGTHRTLYLLGPQH